LFFPHFPTSQGDIMAHVKSMSGVAKKYITNIMADGEMRNLTQIIDELYETRISSASRYIPTRAELNRYLRSENYSSEIRREVHPLALPHMRNKSRKTTYFWRELDDNNNC